MHLNKKNKSTIEQWRIFQAVVHYGGYAQAALKLNRSASSLNHAVAKLQDMLGLELLRVEGRRAQLTEHGEVMLRRARLLSQNLSELELQAEALAQGWETQLKIYCELIYPRHLLHSALHDFLPISHNTRLEIANSVLSGSSEAIERRLGDIVICSHLPQGVLGMRIADVEMLPVVHASHPLAKVEHAIARDTLSKHLQLVISETGENRNNQGWLRSEQRWTVANFDEAMAILHTGMGFCWLPLHMVAKALEHGELCELKLENASRRLHSCYLVCPKGDSAGPACNTLKTLIIEHAQNISRYAQIS